MNKKSKCFTGKESFAILREIEICGSGKHIFVYEDEFEED